MSRFIDTTLTKRIEISGGDYIVIKHRLSVGAQKHIDTSGLKRLVSPTKRSSKESNDTSVEVDFKEFSFARTEAYLLEWSFRDDDGKAVPVSRTAIEALDTKSYEEIENAISAHVEALVAEKKGIPADGAGASPQS